MRLCIQFIDCCPKSLTQSVLYNRPVSRYSTVLSQRVPTKCYFIIYVCVKV